MRGDSNRNGSKEFSAARRIAFHRKGLPCRRQRQELIPVPKDSGKPGSREASMLQNPIFNYASLRIIIDRGIVIGESSLKQLLEAERLFLYDF